MKKISKYIWLFLGFVFAGLSFVGAALPLLPAFPFIVLTLFCFGRSSEKVHNWFIGTKLYKNNLEKIVKRREITIKGKIYLVLSITVTMGIAFYFMRNTNIGRIVLGIVWFFHVIYFIFGLKTIGQEQKLNIIDERQNG